MGGTARAWRWEALRVCGDGRGVRVVRRVEGEWWVGWRASGGWVKGEWWEVGGQVRQSWRASAGKLEGNCREVGAASAGQHGPAAHVKARGQPSAFAGTTAAGGSVARRGRLSRSRALALSPAARSPPRVLGAPHARPASALRAGCRPGHLLRLRAAAAARR
eukprot:6889254-Prymnesium_polylepis.1